MDVEARMEIVNQDLKLLRTLQSEESWKLLPGTFHSQERGEKLSLLSQERSKLDMEKLSLDISNLEKELLILNSIKKIDHESKRFKQLNDAGKTHWASAYLAYAREKLVQEQVSLAGETFWASLLCSNMNIEDELKKLKALKPNSSDSHDAGNIRSAIEVLETLERGVKAEVVKNEGL